MTARELHEHRAQLGTAAELITSSQAAVHDTASARLTTSKAIARSRDCLTASADRSGLRAIVLTVDGAERDEMACLAAYLKGHSDRKFVAFGEAVEAAVRAAK